MITGALVAVALYKRKKYQDNKRQHALLSSLGEQWKKEKSNTVDPFLFPRSFSNLDENGIGISQETVSFQLGWRYEGVAATIDDIQLFCAVLAKNGELLELITPYFPASNFGIKHTGLDNLQNGSVRQNIVIHLPNVRELSKAHYIVVGTLMDNIVRGNGSLSEEYMALFNGTGSQDAHAVARIQLGGTESAMGMGNGFIFGAIILDDKNNFGSWYFSHICSPIRSKSIGDIIPRMQQIVIHHPEVSNSSIINFKTEKRVVSVWFGFDRFGYLRFTIEQQFPQENIVLANFNATGVTKIFLVTMTAFNQGDSFLIAREYQYPVIQTNIQLVCGFFTHEVNANIPFPVRMLDNSVYCVPFLASITGPSHSAIIGELREKYVPFTANTITVTVIQGNDLTFPPSQKKVKTGTITPVVSVTLNKIKQKTAAKKDISPIWDETFVFALQEDWILKDSVVTFTVKDKKSGKLLGKNAYCLKSLRIPYFGALQLEGGVGSLSVSIDVMEETATKK